MEAAFEQMAANFSSTELLLLGFVSVLIVLLVALATAFISYSQNGKRETHYSRSLAEFFFDFFTTPADVVDQEQEQPQAQPYCVEISRLNMNYSTCDDRFDEDSAFLDSRRVRIPERVNNAL